MSNPDPVTSEQIAALTALGVPEELVSVLVTGTMIAYSLPTKSAPGIGLLQLADKRLRSGIFSINDVGGGLITFARFRSNSFRVAASFGLAELELFGAELINEKLAQILVEHGFQRVADRCPEELGGGMLTILARVFPVSVS